MNGGSLNKEYVALLERFQLAPIRNQEDLAAATAVMLELTTPVRYAALTEEEMKYLDVLTALIGQYEDAHCRPLAEPMAPNEVLQYLMEESGVSQHQLARTIGARQSHISVFLAGRRDLSKDTIVKLAHHFKVSTDLFLGLRSPTAPRRQY